MKHFKLMKGVLACLLSLALVVSCFTTVGAKADETSGSGTATATVPTAVSATFKWATNTIEADSAAVVYVLKAKTGNNIKKGAKSVTLAKADQNATKFSATMTDLGIKKAKKDVYLYVCDKEFEDAATNISANLEIKAPAAKKLVGTIDYTKADGTSTTFNVISASAVDDKKAAIKDPEIWWSTEESGTYFQVNDGTESATRVYGDTAKTKAPNGFDGRTLNEMLAAGGGTIYIKMAGKDGATGDAQFGSQAVKVKVAKQAKAPKAKVDAKKDTLSLKNGFDFGFAVQNPETKEYDVQKWFTILPQLKNAAVKTSDASIVATTAYTPLAKKDSNAGKEVTSESGDKTYSYTAYKFKALSIDTIIKTFKDCTSLGYTGGDCIIAVRKSATEKKPASAASYIELSAQSDKPLVYTQDNVKGEFLVATADDFDKKGIIAGTVVPYPGSVSGQPTRIATEGYDDSFKVGSVSGQTIVNADTNGSTYEFAILAQKDLVATGEKAIDISTIAWKKFDPAKTKITSKLKTKYSLIDGTKTTAQLDTVAAKVVADSGEATIAAQYSGVKNFIVIRRTGNSKSSLRASNWIYLYVVKNGKTYELYSTVDNGEVAYKYTVDFYKWSLSGESTYAWKKDDTLTVTGWGKNSTEKAEIAAITNADLFALTGDNNTIAEDKTSLSGGKLVVEVEGADITKKYAIREYANVEIVAAISGESTTKTLVKIVNGKSSISGDDTVYYVGKEIIIDKGDVSANEPSESGYNISIKANVTSPETGFAKVNEDGDEISTTVNTAENTVIKVTYTKTPVTKALDFVGYSNEDYDYEIVDESFSEQPHKATYGVDVKFTVTAATGKNIISVKYKIGSDESIQYKTLTEVNGVYTIPGTEILDAVKIKVEVEAASQGGNG
jgi:hypothetical protein